VFPTSSPYITSVGGTEWSGGPLFPNPKKPIAWSRSGGGFSWQFPMAKHQRLAVSTYLEENKAHLPPLSSFNGSTRAYPDVSAVAVYGTSQSAPTIAGIFSLITDIRFQKGLPPLGFLGPRLYQMHERFPGESWEDITEGNTNTSCDNGFSASVGWDPLTGLGRPVWTGLQRHFASDENI
ncbi:hypothetical protein AAMO2058_001725500, partial [Amorphochlora amoebiformis]